MASTQRPEPGEEIEYVSRHLEAALAVDDPTEKNYHVRTALQWIELGLAAERLVGST